MRIRILVLGCLAFTTPAFAQRTPLADVPFVLHQNAIIIPALINGADTVHLLLDTGWGPLALLARATDRLGLAVDRREAGGLGRAQVASISIGAVVQTNPFIEVFPTSALAAVLGPHDGVLSTAFFRDLVLQVDYPAKRVRFYREAPAAAASGQRVTVPMSFSPIAPGLPFTDSVSFDGRPARALFDTGGSGAFVAMPRLVARERLLPIPDSGRVGIGMVSGDTTVVQRVSFTKVRRISIGPFGVDSARVMLAPSQLGGSNWGHDLVIGYGFMRNYIVTFDYPGRRITLEGPR